MIEITLKISDKENGTPGEVCELIQKAIENIERPIADGFRFEVESGRARRIDLREESPQEKLVSILRIIIANAKMIPDPSMQGATDIYAVPLDDITEAQNILNEVA